MTAEQALNSDIRLGVQRGTNEHAYLEQLQQEKKLPFTLRPYDSPPMAIADLLNGRIEAAALDSASGQQPLPWDARSSPWEPSPPTIISA